jgi:hypothetical protein
MGVKGGRMEAVMCWDSGDDCGDGCGYGRGDGDGDSEVAVGCVAIKESRQFILQQRAIGRKGRRETQIQGLILVYILYSLPPYLVPENILIQRPQHKCCPFQPPNRWQGTRLNICLNRTSPSAWPLQYSAVQCSTDSTVNVIFAASQAHADRLSPSLSFLSILCSSCHIICV